MTEMTVTASRPPAASLHVSLVSSADDGQRWDRFVAIHPEATNYHRWNWRHVIERAFRWPVFYLLAEEAGEIRGVLPLAWQKSRLFGNFLTSLPFLNAGGALASDASTEQRLIDEATALAERLGARHLELRYRGRAPEGMPAKANKITLVRPVEPDEEKMFAALPHKVRTDLRKAMKNDFQWEFGGAALLDAFYPIFARNMRDLGTPVYGRDFFAEMLRAFPEDAHVVVIRHRGRPVAGSFLTGFRGVLEAGWSASDYAYLAMKPNMFLYWRILCFAGQRGYRLFDFGRSSIGSGTHRFKKQWGTEEIPLRWVYWLRSGGDLPEMNPENPKYRLAIRVWRRLPVGLARILGPRIVRCLP